MYGGVKGLWREVESTMLFQRDSPFFIDFHATGRGERPYVMSVSGGVENGGGCPFQRAQGVNLLQCEELQMANGAEFRCV